MNEAFDYEKLAEALREIAPRMSASERLWDVSMIAEYMGMSASQVYQRIVCHPDFPAAIRLPTANGRGEKSKAHPRWESKDVVAWVRKWKS